MISKIYWRNYTQIGRQKNSPAYSQLFVIFIACVHVLFLQWRGIIYSTKSVVIHNHAWRSVAGKCHRPLSVCCISFENLPGGMKNTSGGSSSSSTAEERNRAYDTNEDKGIILSKDDYPLSTEKKYISHRRYINFVEVIAYRLLKNQNAWLELFSTVWMDVVPKMPVDDPSSNRSSRRMLCCYDFPRP